MAIEHTTITLPAFWASALVNGDTSGMNYEDLANMEAWLDKALAGGWYVVSDVEDSERFTWHYQLYGGTAKGGTVLDYIIHRQLKGK
jgi:hypothetical protein